MYPIPSKLFTLKLETGLQAFKERELESWLETITFKHKRDFFNYEDVLVWRGDEFVEHKKLPFAPPKSSPDHQMISDGGPFTQKKEAYRNINKILRE
jgi:hypothetical protein